MANPARAAGGLPSGGSLNDVRAFINSDAFRNLPPHVQQQILDSITPPGGGGALPPPPGGSAPPGAGGGGMIPRGDGGILPPGAQPPARREPPVIRIPGAAPDAPPPGRLPPPDAPRGLPDPNAPRRPDAPDEGRRFPWEATAAALGLGGIAAFAPAIIDYFDGDDPNLAGAATPINMDPDVGGGGRGARALGAQNAPAGGTISPRHRARVNYWAERTGVPVPQVAEMFAADPNKALVDLNMMASQQHIDRNKAARDRWQATAILAGGSHNINSGNRGAYNILNELEGEDRDRALLYMTPAGPMAAAVDARDAERASVMAQRAVEGMAGRIMTPQQQALAQAQVDQANRQKPVEEQAMAFVQQPDIHPTELDAADSYVDTLYSEDGVGYMLGGNSSSFTVAEQQQTVDYLVRNRGYTPQKAQRIVDEIARRRHASSWQGNPMR